MNWGTWEAFVAMGGHGAFVWGSVLVVLLALLGELVLLGWRRQAVLRGLRQRLERRR